VEYACSESPLGFLSHVLLPYARERLNLVDVSRSPGAFSVMGASMGGLMALYTALRMPEVFGGVLSQSGAFSLFEHDMPVFDLLTLPRRLPLRAWLEVGLYDIYDLLPANRRMKALLDEQGFAPGYWEYPAGHNYTAWRRNLWRGLEYLFGGKDDR
jgi:enterochelin esterase family protein